MFKKNTLFFFMFVLSTIVSSHLHATKGEQDDLFTLKDRKIQITDYKNDTFLICDYNVKQEFTQVGFNIHTPKEEEKIGQILLQYYPSAPTEIYRTSTGPTIRIRSLKIDKKFRQKGHAGRALETLFTALRKSKFPNSTKLYLECNTGQLDPSLSYLHSFFKKFGFTPAENTAYQDVKILNVSLKKIKFPYYQQVKKEDK